MLSTPFSLIPHELGFHSQFPTFLSVSQKPSSRSNKLNGAKCIKYDGMKHTNTK